MPDIARVNLDISLHHNNSTLHGGKVSLCQRSSENMQPNPPQNGKFVECVRDLSFIRIICMAGFVSLNNTAAKIYTVRQRNQTCKANFKIWNPTRVHGRSSSCSFQAHNSWACIFGVHFCVGKLSSVSDFYSNTVLIQFSDSKYLLKHFPCPKQMQNQPISLSLSVFIGIFWVSYLFG